MAANAVSKQDYDNAVATQAGRGGRRGRQGGGRYRADQPRLYRCRLAGFRPSRHLAVTPGAYVQASQATLMSTVQQLDPVYVDLTQSSLDGLKLRRAERQAETSGPGARRVADPGRRQDLFGSRQAAVLGRDGRPDHRLGDDSRDLPESGPRAAAGHVRARADRGRRDENAFLVPQIGVTHDQKGQAIALVVNAANKVETRPLTTAGTYGPNWIVEGGLQAGDHVIVQGVDKVRPGATVKTVAAQLAPAPDAASGTPASAANASGAAPASTVAHAAVRSTAASSAQ